MSNCYYFCETNSTYLKIYFWKSDRFKILDHRGGRTIWWRRWEKWVPRRY